MTFNRTRGWWSWVLAVAYAGTALSTAAATITGFSPDRGATGTEVTIVGSGLQTATFVFFGANEATGEILSRSASSVRARVPANAFTGQISIFTTGAGTASSSAFFYAAPRISEFSPVSGGAGTLVTISGANFGTFAGGGRGNVTNVLFDGKPTRFEISGINQVVALVPTNATSGPITVANEAGSFSTLLPFQVPAQLTAITPFAGAPGDSVSVVGQNLGAVLRVDLGLVTVPFAVLSPTNLILRVPTNAIHATIQVVTPAGVTTTSSNFLVKPRILGFAPAGGAVGTTVRLDGGGFQGVTEVRFNGTKATFVVGSSTAVDATVPAGASTGPVSIVTTNGTFVTEALFALPPRLTSFSPPSGKRGDVVTLDGQSLNGVTNVTLAGVRAEFSVLSPTRILATVPALATTGRFAIESAGGSVSSGGTFTVLPLLDAFTPGNGPVGSPVSLTGAGLTNLASVRLGDLDATFTVLNSTNVRVIIPLNAFSGPFLVRSSSGQEVTMPGNFFVDGAHPVVSSFAPTSGSVGTRVLVQGEGFRTTSKVQFGAVEAVFVVKSPRQLEVTIPAGVAAGRFAVTTLDGIGQSEGLFTVGEPVVQLMIEIENGSLRLRWPASATGFGLQSNSALGGGTSWVPVGTQPVVEGTNTVVTLTLPAEGARYFRLAR